MSPAKKRIHKSIEVLRFTDYDGWLEWLADNHQQHEAIWIQLGKKKSGVQSITYEESREGAIRFGWIDGLINPWDDQYYLTRFSQRRPRSKWSMINREIAKQLIKDGLMMPSGQVQVDAAKDDGRWQAAYSSQASIKVPKDLQSRLDKDPKASAFFESLTKANRYSFLYRIETAKKKETRQKWIDRTMEMLAAGETFRKSDKKAVKKKARKKK